MVPVKQRRIKRKRLPDGEERLSQAQPGLLGGRVIPEERREFVTQVTLFGVHRQIRQQHLRLLARNGEREFRIAPDLESPKKRQPELRHGCGTIALLVLRHHPSEGKTSFL